MTDTTKYTAPRTVSAVSADKAQTDDDPGLSEEALAKAMSGVLTDEQQTLIEKLDKETSVRKLANAPLAKIFSLLCIAVSLYHFITSYFGTPVILVHRSVHVSMMLAL
ncbi:MAG: hypothetical protein LBV76_04795, partial [Deltaproteobacteria bacterium]|nr:hypothetical protein [Deltaproteobacteria bacterium]